MRFLPVTRYGELFGLAVVDDDIYAEVSDHSWCVTGAGYVYSYIANRHDSGRGEAVTLLHRYVLRLHKGDGLAGHHGPGGKLDNTRANLTVMTRSEHARLEALEGWERRRRTTKRPPQPEG